MALASGRRLWVPAFFSLALFALIWLLVAATGVSGAAYWYLFLGIAEPLVFAVVMFVPEGSSVGAFAALCCVVASGVANLVQFILRFFTVTRPFDTSDILALLFLALNGAAVAIYVWYGTAAYRNWLAESSRVAVEYDKSSDTEEPMQTSLRRRY